MTGEFDGAAAAGSGPTVGELFRSRAKIQSADTAIEYQGRQVSYGQLLGRVEGLTAMLSASGLCRGDRIALLSRNRPEYIEIELAAANSIRSEEHTTDRQSHNVLAYQLFL